MSYLDDIKSVLKISGEDKIVKDSSKGNTHSISAINEVKRIQHEQITANIVQEGGSFQTLEEMKQQVKVTLDSFINPMSQVGTYKDPGTHAFATIPVMLSPYEATALYASGGLPEIIINKKSKGVLLNGYNFVSNNKFWSPDKITILKEALDSTNFEEALSDGMRDGLLYGGALLYPTLRTDSAISYDFSIAELISQGHLKKGCISRWTQMDRWNTVVIPNYNPTAADYLSSDKYYVPLAGVSVATERAAVIRPKKLPYWGALMQLGWGTSDFEGYMRSVYAYEIMLASVPIMAQQMSLLLYELPLDGMLAQMGVDTAKRFMQLNDESMRNWSMSNPKTINALGKVYAVNRQYTGYSDLGLMLRQDIGAQTGLPEAALFHTQPKGFSNNTEEILLKESQTVKLTQKQVAPAMVKVKDMAICHAFGADSEEYKNREYLHFTFDNPVVATESERAEAAARAAATINSLRQAGMPLGEAIRFTQKFFRYITVDQDIIDASIERDTVKTALELKEKEASVQKLEKEVAQENTDDNAK